jgi:hypothetical protein
LENSLRLITERDELLEKFKSEYISIQTKTEFLVKLVEKEYTKSLHKSSKIILSINDRNELFTKAFLEINRYYIKNHNIEPCCLCDLNLFLKSQREIIYKEEKDENEYPKNDPGLFGPGLFGCIMCFITFMIMLYLISLISCSL